jgi:hypothetical protein
LGDGDVSDIHVPRWLAIAALVVGIVGGFLGIWTWWRTPSEDLNADVHFGPFSLPTGLLDRALHRDSLLDVRDVERALHWLEVRRGGRRTDSAEVSATHRDLANEVARRVRDRMGEAVGGLDGYWDVEIRNDGNKVVSGVVLTHPGARHLCLYFADSVTCPRPQSRLRLGDLHPRERVRVRIWTRYDEPSLFDAKNFQLTHESGIGSVAVYAPMGPVGRGVVETARVLGGLLFFVAFIFGITSLVVFGGYFIARARGQKAAS